MRKVLGSTKSQLIKQFLAESVLLTFIAVLVAIVLVEAFLPSFNQLANKKLEITFFNNWLTIPALLIFSVLMVGLIAGSYPSFFFHQ